MPLGSDMGGRAILYSCSAKCARYGSRYLCSERSSETHTLSRVYEAKGFQRKVSEQVNSLPERQPCTVRALKATP